MWKVRRNALFRKVVFQKMVNSNYDVTGFGKGRTTIGKIEGTVLSKMEVIVDRKNDEYGRVLRN